MSHVQQTCPLCSWDRFVRVPQTTDPEFDDVIARHVARSLQWEWQAHVMREHSPEMVNAYDVLTLAGFDHWVAQEGQQPTMEETPPAEGVGQTVRANLPTITPEQAKQLADAVERTMISAAEGIQRFAEHMVPALNAAQEQIVNGLRDLVEKQRQHAGCTCNGGPGDHQPGQDGCLYQVAGIVDLTSTRILADAAKLAPGAGTPEWWQKLYGAVPLHVQRDLADGVPGDRPYGTVDAEICSNCQRLAGKPHGLPSCLELS